MRLALIVATATAFAPARQPRRTVVRAWPWEKDDAPAPAPAPPAVAKDAQVALFSQGPAPKLVNTAADATSGDDVSAALQAARLKATTKAGAVKPKAAAAAPAAPAPAADSTMALSAIDPRNLDTAIANLRDPGTEDLAQAIENLRAKPAAASGKSRNLDEAITNARALAQ